MAGGDQRPPPVEEWTDEIRAWVTEARTDKVHTMFVRFVPRGTVYPADTIFGVDAHVDIGPDGRIIGISVAWVTDEENDTATAGDGTDTA